MEPTESSTHSFTIRLWIEEVDQSGGRVTWRGHITEVSSGERRYIQDLNDIAMFIWPYLERMGVGPPLSWRIRRRLDSRRR